MKFLFKHNVSYYFIILVQELKIVKNYVINFEKDILFTKNQAFCVKKTENFFGISFTQRLFTFRIISTDF